MVCSAPYLPWLMVKHQWSRLSWPACSLTGSAPPFSGSLLPAGGGSSLVISTPQYSTQAASTTLALSPMFLTRAG